MTPAEGCTGNKLHFHSTSYFTFIVVAVSSQKEWLTCVHVPGLAYRQFGFTPKMEFHTCYNSLK